MADFHARGPEFDAAGIRVIGASTDTAELARQTLAQTALGYPLAFGLDAREFAAATGAFFDAQKNYLHAAGFLLAPSGALGAALYSTGPMGRLLPDECLRMVAWLKQRT